MHIDIKRHDRWVVLSSLLLLLFYSCQQNNELHNVRDFYFPVDELEEGLVYEYASAGADSMVPEYWFYKSFQLDSGFYFTGQYYDYQFEVQQLVTEEVVSNGTLLHQLYMYEQDSMGQVIRFPVNVEVPNVFPFHVRDSGGIFLYRINWVSPLQPERKTTLIRNRKYTGMEGYTFNGKQYDAIRFSVKDLIETEEEGFQEIQYSGEEIYARGIGLVYYRKEITKELVLEYKLKEIYSMKDFEQKFSTHFSKNTQ